MRAACILAAMLALVACEKSPEREPGSGSYPDPFADVKRTMNDPPTGPEPATSAASAPASSR